MVAVKHLGLADYEQTWRSMQAFTNLRTHDTEDEFWILEHPPVFTLGQNAKKEHLLNPADIPVIQVDRGGQVTYHGPGQLVLYPLVDLARINLGVHDMVRKIERAIIAILSNFQIPAICQPGVPGVFVGENKIASIGLRVRRGCSYHGLSLNVSMDMLPFTRINPCGYTGLKMVQMKDWRSDVTVSQVGCILASELTSEIYP